MSVDMYNSVHDPPIRSSSQHEDNDDLSVADGEDETPMDQVKEDEVVVRDVVMVEDYDL